jgi:hypothetical protein
VSLGDALVLLGIAVAVLLYALERAASQRRDLDAALSLLLAVRDGMPWGDLYFGDGYDDAQAIRRAEQDYDLVREGAYGEIFEVPAAPLEALVTNPATGDYIERSTVHAVNVALWQIGVFNQFVRQKTDFNTRHLVEILDEELPEPQRLALARAARSQSQMLHSHGVGINPWYANLKRELSANIEVLKHRRSRRWWTRWSIALAVVFVAAALIAVTWTSIDRATGSTPKPLPSPTTTTK